MAETPRYMKKPNGSVVLDYSEYHAKRHGLIECDAKGKPLPVEKASEPKTDKPAKGDK